jgi:hypothetical protein
MAELPKDFKSDGTLGFFVHRSDRQHRRWTERALK